MKNKQTNMIIAKTADERNLFCSEKQKQKKNATTLCAANLFNMFIFF